MDLLFEVFIMLQIGDKVPEFHQVATNGEKISNKSFLGTITVLYFYPKDDTPGCTAEACSFRDEMAEMTQRGISVIGISPDSISSHQQFIAKHNLNFTLIADEDQSVCKKFDVIKEKEMYGKKVMGVERTTFLIDNHGIIRWLERPVKVENHVERVLNALNEVAPLL
jgi:thioredoxin-dependent peroxiredoxin